MTYDNYGNIASKNGVVYTYGNTAWKDLLTGYGDKTITYDVQGNPVNYLGHTLTWEKGRLLKQFTKADGTVIDYTYNANGIRTSKTITALDNKAGVTHTYTLDGTKILRETWTKDGVNHSIVPMYDNEDSVCGIQYNGEPYYFQKNLQGDIIAIVDKDADTVTRYSYDAWGVCTITEDSSECNIAEVNPYRYRGYYFDAEIEMYYLQSRYYEPFVGKFINGDDMLMFLLSDYMTISSNIYVYCENRVVNKADYNGFKSTTYKGITCTSSKKGFDVNMHLKFLVKSFCLQYANHVISRWGSKNKYLGMDKTRIAKELFGHEVLFVLGVVVAGYSIASLVNVNTARTLLSKLTGIIVTAASGYVAYYLIDHAKKINVNYDETALRMTVFNVIWLFF